MQFVHDFDRAADGAGVWQRLSHQLAHAHVEKGVIDRDGVLRKDRRKRLLGCELVAMLDDRLAERAIARGELGRLPIRNDMTMSLGVPIHERRRELTHFQREPLVAMHQGVVKIEGNRLPRHASIPLVRPSLADGSTGGGF
jgi:hypothetical protein